MLLVLGSKRNWRSLHAAISSTAMTPSTEPAVPDASSNDGGFVFVVAKPEAEGGDPQKPQRDAIIEACRQIRTEVFINEQEIPIDIEYDGIDHVAYHVLCRRNPANDDATTSDPVATGRLVVVDNNGDATDGNNDMKRKGIIARIAVRKEFRGKRLGSQIVRKLESIALDLNISSLSLKPHKHLEKFYNNLGFETVPDQTVFAGKHELIIMKKDCPDKKG